MTEPQADLLVDHPVTEPFGPPPPILDMLRKRHEGGEWVLLEEVAPSTGGGTRYADALAVNLWRSRGHAICGFEIKVSRGDWLRELKQPEKAEPIFRYCNTWWIVAPKGIVKPGELPPSWGLLEPRGNALAVSVQAPPLTPAPIDLPFFASLVRRAFEAVDRRAENLVRDELLRARAARSDEVEAEVRRRTRKGEQASEIVRNIEAKIGMPLQDWSIDSTLRTLELARRLELLGGYSGQMLGRLSNTADDLERLAKTLREVADSTKADVAVVKEGA